MTKPKKVRFYYNGKRRKDIYPEHTNLYVMRYKITTFLKTWSLGLLALAIIVTGTWLHSRANAKVCGLQAVQCINE